MVKRMGQGFYNIMPCNCHEDARVSICARCERLDTVALMSAFEIGGYKVDLEYCLPHIHEWIDERNTRGLCLQCDGVKTHDRGCPNGL